MFFSLWRKKQLEHILYFSNFVFCFSKVILCLLNIPLVCKFKSKFSQVNPENIYRQNGMWGSKLLHACRLRLAMCLCRFVIHQISSAYRISYCMFKCSYLMYTKANLYMRLMNLPVGFLQVLQLLPQCCCFSLPKLSIKTLNCLCLPSQRINDRLACIRKSIKAFFKGIMNNS